MVHLILATPPWLPLAMAGGLLVVLGFLYWSMRRNIERIDVDADAAPASPVSPPE